MNNTHALLLALLLTFLTGCDPIDRQSIEHQKLLAKHDARVWMGSRLGVKYFYDCIDGVRYIITSRLKGYGIAGPLGECK